ncbi:MAG: aryl-sulfate sulfotransferase [Bacteroidota bacterium]
MRFLLCLVFCVAVVIAGRTQPGIKLNTENSFPGYTLFSSFNGTNLIDNCGELVNNWNTGAMNNHPKLLPNGHLLYMTHNTIYEVDWNNNIIVSTVETDLALILEYEIIKLPNENYLCLGRRDFSLDEFRDIGYNLNLGFPSVVDVVVEVARESGEIVWEWNIADHVIQERDPMLPNYGSVANHPELLNVDAIATYDWQSYESFMINGMDYNPTLDQIALSVRKISEVVIIDHSTTTTEAAGSTGGNSGRGGDILYRWGNPQNYGRGTSADRQLFFQHNPNWITEGPYAGHLIIYDNGLNRPDVAFNDRYSTVPIINPPVDAQGNYQLLPDSAYAPAVPTLRYSKVDGDAPFYSGYTSGAEWLPNGNIFITEGVNGYLKELNPEGELVWEYQVPTVGYVFRTERYPLDYPAFDNQELSPQGPVPNTGSDYECMLTTSTQDFVATATLAVRAWAGQQRIYVHHETEHALAHVLYNAAGQPLQRGISPPGDSEINVKNYPTGLYLLSFWSPDTGQMSTEKIVLHE